MKTSTPPSRPSGNSLRRLSDVAGDLIHDRHGIIEYVKEVRRAPGAPAFFHFYARAANVRAFLKHGNSRDAGGASSVRELALAKAIGEAIERYSSAIYDQSDFPLATYESAPFRCIKPGDFALHGPEQYARSDFPYVPFNEHTPVRWAEMTEPLSGESWHVPAAMVYMPYFYDEEHGERSIGERISTGLACHCSFEDAAISAICEVVERDAISMTWQARMAPPRIRPDTLSAKNRDLVDRFARTGGVVTLFNLTLDHGIPTVLSVLRGRDPDQPAFVFAGAAHPNPHEAMRKSLEELAHSRHLAHQLKTQMPPFVPSAGFENVREQDDHVHLYCDHQAAPLVDFLFASDTALEFQNIDDISTGDRREDVKVLCRKIRAVHHKVLLSDVTSPDIHDLGLAVVRAVIPGFHPLFLGHQRRALGGSRLWTIPQQLGYPGIMRETGDNPAPHPYP